MNLLFSTSLLISLGNSFAATAQCSRDAYFGKNSPNKKWHKHTKHDQVWYHTLEDIHSLWKENYFDYVLDIRPLQDSKMPDGMLLEGWETFHIPGSYPIAVSPDTAAEDVDMLVDFDSSEVCKAARIFVHCWSGISGNKVAKTLIELGFTNIHAAGPEGSAGMWDWKAAGYEVKTNDTFDANAPHLQPACIDTCLIDLTPPLPTCDSDVTHAYSIVDPNASWTNHPFHRQVWYHTLENIHSLWKENYFDYVLDIRPLQDSNMKDGTLLEGWKTFHIPGSYPIAVSPDTAAEDVDMLVNFQSSKVCKDARIFVHCWSGISGNKVARTLIELGFTNIHAAGPQGSAGMWDWKAAGYEVVTNDTFDATDARFQPACIDTCALEPGLKPCLQDRKVRFQMTKKPGVDRKCGRKKYNAKRCKKPIVGGGTVRDKCPVACNVCEECKNSKGKYQVLNRKRSLTCKQLAKRGNCLEIVSEFDETNVFDYCPLACNTCPGVL